MWFATFFTTFAANKFSETALTFRFLNMTRKKKIMIIVFSLITICCLWYWWALWLIDGSKTKVTYTEFKMSDNNQFLMTDEGYIFDTGSNATLLYASKTVNACWLCFSFSIDNKINISWVSYYYTKSCQVGKGFNVFGFVCQRPDTTVHSKVFPDIKGIIGTNVLRKANWLYSLKLHKAAAFPLDSIVSIPDDAITFSYHEHWRLPLTDLAINGQILKNVLIDTGFDEDLLLKDGTDAPINLGEVIQQDSVERIAINSKWMLQKKVFKSVKVNSKSYQNLNVILGGNSRNLLGLGFMRRFDYIFWDSKHKKVYLWNDKSSENK